MAKKRVGKFPKAFRQRAVTRLTPCDTIVALAKELASVGGCGLRGASSLRRWRVAKDRRRIRARPPSGKRSADSSVCWPRRCWKWIFSPGPCTTSRRDVSGAAQLARRHLRPHPGRDVEARRIEDRADVSVGPGEPSGILPVVASTPAHGRRHGRAVGHSRDRRRTPASVWLPAHYGGTAAARNAGES